jgi:hypothetical protein
MVCAWKTGEVCKNWTPIVHASVWRYPSGEVRVNEFIIIIIIIISVWRDAAYD